MSIIQRIGMLGEALKECGSLPPHSGIDHKFHQLQKAHVWSCHIPNPGLSRALSCPSLLLRSSMLHPFLTCHLIYGFPPTKLMNHLEDITTVCVTTDWGTIF